MPAIILANYIFYREQEYSLKRDLQVKFGCSEKATKFEKIFHLKFDATQ